MKRVYTLYRVSSKGQVIENDIPMQKQAAREFADRNGWVIDVYKRQAIARPIQCGIKIPAGTG